MWPRFSILLKTILWNLSIEEIELKLDDLPLYDLGEPNEFVTLQNWFCSYLQLNGIVFFCIIALRCHIVSLLSAIGFLVRIWYFRIIFHCGADSFSISVWMSMFHFVQKRILVQKLHKSWLNFKLKFWVLVATIIRPLSQSLPHIRACVSLSHSEKLKEQKLLPLINKIACVFFSLFYTRSFFLANMKRIHIVYI